MTVMAQPAAERNSNQENSDTQRIVAEWPINQREHVRVAIEYYRGIWLCDIRKWYENKAGGRSPGRQGIALNVAHLPRVAQAIAAAQSIAREHGLIADTAKQEK
jgi:hypothetical protein